MFTHMILFFPLFVVPPFPVFALSTSSNGKVAVGASITAGQNSSSWLSPSGDFALGFRSLQNNADLFLLSIWFDKIPDKTIVWYANEDQPVTRGSKLNLTADSGLVLTDPQGRELWKSEPIPGEVASGAMSDYGNFALEAKNSSSDKLWETFKNPTDTILPGQTIDRDGFIHSRRSDSDFSKGRFELKLQQDGNLVLYTINLPTNNPNFPYYGSSTTTGSVPGSEGLHLVFNTTGDLYVLRVNNGRFFPKEVDQLSSTDNYFRATLNYDGIFTKYYYPKSSSNANGSWIPIWSIPDNICVSLRVDAGLGVCGYNSICTLGSDQRPSCDCPPRFSLINPNDIYGDCKPDFPQGCAEDELLVNSSSTSLDSSSNLYRVEELLNTDWPTSDYITLKPFTGERCRDSCLQDCMCAVSIFRNGTCFKKKLPLSNGRVDSSLISQAFIKVRSQNVTTLVPESPTINTNPHKEKEKHNQGTLILIGSLLLGTSVLFNAVLVGAICVGFSHKKHKTTTTTTTTTQQTPVQIHLKSFSYKQLEEATNGFELQLGKGAFGVVYKGLLQTGSGSSLEVAVKKLNCVMEDSEKEFKNEVDAIGQTHHKNLVRLLGYCDEEQHRLLVYEFMSNGTLANYLFGEIKPPWSQRIKIADGIARGILYLHEECSSQIIHCDIKPQNILLDQSNNARISDFGLSKLLMMDQSHTHTAIRGTKGYVAPEWFRNNMHITAKVDVYSFGVVLLEIICCRRSVESENVSGEEKGILTDWAYDCYQEGALDLLVNCDEILENKKQLEVFVMVALWCIQENPSLRPTISKVVQMLEGVVEVPCPPCPSPYSTTTVIPVSS